MLARSTLWKGRCSRVKSACRDCVQARRMRGTMGLDEKRNNPVVNVNENVHGVKKKENKDLAVARKRECEKHHFAMYLQQRGEGSTQ